MSGLDSLRDGSPPESRFRRVLAALREAVAGSQQDFTSGSLNRAVVLLAVPMILEMAMESVFAICDAFFVARLGGDHLAAVGLAESVLTLVYGLAVGLSMGTTAMVARRIGEKKPQEAARTGVQAIALGSFMALVLGVIGVWAAPHVLVFMRAPAGVIEVGTTYTRILFGTNIVIMLLFVNNAIFRGAGDASIAMRALWLANGINLVLDPCLIFGLGPFPELGLTGASIATSIGRGSGVAYQLYRLRRPGGRLLVGKAEMRLMPDVMRRLVRLSSTGAAQWLVATASWVFLVRIVAGFGGVAVAAYTLAIRIIIFALLPAFGVSNAAATLVGQNLGAGKPARAESSVWLTGLYTTLFMLLVTIAFVMYGENLVMLFTTDAQIVAAAAECLRVISYGYVFYAWGMVMVQAFNGAGDTVTPLWLNMLFFWLCQIPLAWGLANHTGMGTSGVYWAVAISESLLALAAMAMFRRGRWKTRKV